MPNMFAAYPPVQFARQLCQFWLRLYQDQGIFDHRPRLAEGYPPKVYQISPVLGQATFE
jgi:hypothetical protein